MHGPDQSEAVIGVLAIVVLAIVAIWRIIAWIKNSPVRPDPWESDTEQAVHLPGAVPICHHCLTPVSQSQWFCETCGAAVGPYNNYMPYVYVFSQGEVLRNGVTDRIRVNAMTVGGYFLMALSNYVIFAPIYWYFLFQNLRRIRRQPHDESAS